MAVCNLVVALCNLVAALCNAKLQDGSEQGRNMTKSPIKLESNPYSCHEQSPPSLHWVQRQKRGDDQGEVARAIPPQLNELHLTLQHIAKLEAGF